jgi:predicted alpha/beta hydrolase
MLCAVTSEADYTQDHLEVGGGDRIGLHYYPWPEDTSAPVVVIWPAMGTPARYYRHLAAELGAHGLGVLVVDLRGTGASTPRPSRASRYGYADLAGDVGAVLDLPELKGRRVFLLGHSLGGQACVLHLALNPDARVEGLALVAVGLPYYRTYGRRKGLGVLAFTQSIEAVSVLLRVWPGWGFGGRQARGVIRDWGYTARRGRFPHMGGADTEAALAAFRTPVLAVSVDRDQYTPAPTLDHLVGKLGAAPVERVHYTTAEAGAPLDHFVWTRASKPLAALIARFAGVDSPFGRDGE